MDDMPALAVQVDPFLSNRSGNEDLRAVRRVESEEIAVAVLRVALYKLDDVAVFSPGVVARQQSMVLSWRERGSPNRHGRDHAAIPDDRRAV